MRLIDADALEDVFHYRFRLHHDDDVQLCITASQLDSAPTIDAVPVVRGKWEYISFMTVKCSNCQEIFYELEGGNFCPNCGARMDGRREDGDT